MSKKTAAQVARENDEFRKRIIEGYVFLVTRTGIGTRHFSSSAVEGRLVMTEAVADLNAQDQVKLLELVRDKAEFTKGEDPRGEHDMGWVNHDGESYLFKIDYMESRRSEYFSDPYETDPFRHLTLMHASEY